MTSNAVSEPPKRGSLLTVAKILISAILLGILFWRLPLGTLFSEYQDKLFQLLLVSAACLLAAICVGALRWWVILGAVGATQTLWKAAELTLIGHFFNQLLPTTVGGDTMRIWGVVRQGSSLSLAATTVILDRFVGLSALLVTILLGQPFLFQRLEIPPSASFAIVFIIVAGVLACLILPFLDHAVSRFRNNRITGFVSQLSATARRLLSMPRVTAKTLGLSLITHLILLYIYSYVARGLGVDLSFAAAFAIIPTVALVANLPVSIGGWGVREAGLAAAFVLMGLPADLAVLTSLIVGVANLITGLPGAVMWLLQKRLI